MCTPDGLGSESVVRSYCWTAPCPRTRCHPPSMLPSFDVVMPYVQSLRRAVACKLDRTINQQLLYMINRRSANISTQNP